MLRKRLWVVVCLAALGPASLSSCGNDEGASRPPGPASGGGAGFYGTQAGADAGPGPQGGASDGVSGSAGAATAGRAAMGGADPGITPGSGGSEGGSLGAGGSDTQSTGEQLELCGRLSGLTSHAFTVEQAYARAAIVDCRVTLLIPRNDDLAAFQNELVVWSLELWGCQGSPVTNFALVFGTPHLSAGDATLLVEKYMAAADKELDLSPPEFAAMEAAIERLAKPLVASDSPEPSRPNCPVSGGAGGAGGAADSGGVPATGGAPTVPSAGQGATPQ